jgi:hypothetical protein
MSVETDITALKVSVEEIKKSVDRMDRFLLGNGGSGILDRTTRIEENVRRMEKKLEDEILRACQGSSNNTILLKGLGDSLNIMKESFLDHIRDDDLHSVQGLLLHKNVISTLIVFIIVVHILLPPELNVFSLILKFLGL